MEFSKPVKAFIRDFSEGLDRTTDQFLECIVIHFMSLVSAWEFTYRGAKPFIMPVLDDENGPIEGRNLYMFFFEFYKQEFGGTGEPMEPPRLDPEAYEKEQTRVAAMRRVQELKDNGEIPSDTYGPSKLILEYYEQMKAGKITKERFDLIVSRYKRSSTDEDQG